MSIQVTGVPGMCPCGEVVILDPEVIRVYVEAQGEYMTRCPSCQGLLSITEAALLKFEEAVAKRTPS